MSRQIVITLPEWTEIKQIDNKQFADLLPAYDEMLNMIKNGTPLPKGHGDLIDRKLALSDDGLCEFHMYDDYVKMRNYLKSIPTIIEADKESEEV